MSRERRNSERIPVWFPIEVRSPAAPEGLGISQDASPRGILIASGTNLEVGSIVTITFRLTASAPEQTTTGRVVRVDVNEDDPTGMWPNRLAVMLDTPIEGIASIQPPKA